MNKKELGKKGEELASEYLKRLGYKIVTKNFRTRYGEIDLICEKNGSIIFIEVRTKSNLNLLSPEESLTSKKIDRLKKTSLEFLSCYKKKYKNIKFEFIGIIFYSDKNYKLNHIKDITF